MHPCKKIVIFFLISLFFKGHFTCKSMEVCIIESMSVDHIKGTQMGPLLVLVSPCFRENINVSCKIVSFAYSLDNFSSEKSNWFLFWKIFQNGAPLGKKGLFLTFFSHFLVTREQTKILSSHSPLRYTHVFCSPYLLFLPSQFCKTCEFIMYGFSLVWLLVLIFSAPFWSNQ